MIFIIIYLLIMCADTNAKQSLRKISAKDLYVSDSMDWLTSRFHFSFAEYHDPNNIDFGVLRVMNDDIVQPMVRVISFKSYNFNRKDSLLILTEIWRSFHT